MPHTHITLIGAQPVPVYNLIMFAKANKALFVHSSDTLPVAQNLKTVFGEQCFLKPMEKPFDFEACKNYFNQLLVENAADTFSFNITGGTKIMTLAALEVARKNKIPAYFIDQNNVITNINGGERVVFNNPVPLSVHFKLFGQSAKQSTKFETIDKAMFDLAKTILSDYDNFNPLFHEFRDKRYDENRAFTLKNKHYELHWKPKEQTAIFYTEKTGTEDHIRGAGVFNVLFHTAWFELVVAEIIAQWKFAKQLYWNTIIPQSTMVYAKNEIDLIIDTGIKLFFVECKTHVHDIKDLDKFRNVVKNFGGLASKAILATYYQPKANILEKCTDNKISVFWLYDDKLKKLKKQSELIDLLDKEYLIINPI